jgi:hypothetical protein
MPIATLPHANVLPSGVSEIPIVPSHWRSRSLDAIASMSFRAASTVASSASVLTVASMSRRTDSANGS